MDVYYEYRTYIDHSFLKMPQSRALFCLFRLFYTTQFKYKLIKALMVCLGHEPTAAG